MPRTSLRRIRPIFKLRVRFQAHEMRSLVKVIVQCSLQYRKLAKPQIPSVEDMRRRNGTMRETSVLSVLSYVTFMPP
ncbi:hypothetical protein P280DRAFT_162934 [Massarina eburnea CBS 473.64]|uniref:Uncharacterized protein n=1 Tax=Massarina eburnea CBS 473.64 TaxID=1395130 RepID=A0A6A6RN73_9PLEO|nr:hypothetical protein P280DRAFT_162934 [Massarina eburnea CBS 473.64]